MLVCFKRNKVALIALIDSVSQIFWEVGALYDQRALT